MAQLSVMQRLSRACKELADEFNGSANIRKVGGCDGRERSVWRFIPCAIPYRLAGTARTFVTGSISAPGIVEALEHGLPKDHPLRALYVGQARVVGEEEELSLYAPPT